MKLTLMLILCLCLFGLVFGNTMTMVTKPPFLRSRYSLRWRKTTPAATEATTGHPMELATSSEHPKMRSSTATVDYDYYGNGEAENVVHK
ncbi:uncharacterized protein LOC117584967 [Drosophila guanche]|uniref:Uncharacterized protein n=1 Tax=Drosophila guanche TaxID=7266 RepID=A0A3B0JPS1_DROGU|nr:uncharacterized protein LOC117584967 [Drosophila guanche]SPP82903.1 Hypothetical predicted protein [Drosophila guanche]